MRHRLSAMVLVVGLTALLGGWWFSASMMEPQQTQEQILSSPAELLGQRRPAFSLGGLDGQWLSASDLEGTVTLINFWATWCAPCLREMPMLAEVHESYRDQGFQVVGIAMDNMDEAREFATELEISYPVLVGMADVMATGLDYGNRDGLLPYSVLIDREGVVRWTRLGEVKRDDLLSQMRPLL